MERFMHIYRQDSIRHVIRKIEDPLDDVTSVIRIYISLFLSRGRKVWWNLEFTSSWIEAPIVLREHMHTFSNNLDVTTTLINLPTHSSNNPHWIFIVSCNFPQADFHRYNYSFVLIRSSFYFCSFAAHCAVLLELKI